MLFFFLKGSQRPFFPLLLIYPFLYVKIKLPKEVFLMWDFSTLKQNARNSLKSFGFWTPVFVCLMHGLLAGTSYGGSAASSESSEETTIIDTFFPQLDSLAEDPFFSFIVIAIAIALIILIIAFALAWSAFIGGPATVGKNRFFMEHRFSRAQFKKLFWAYGCGSYLNVVKIMFVYEVKLLLWTLLFIIPGIIKSYEYFMVPYILAENPTISCEDAFYLSKKMTDGEKASIFFLQLSFIGWYFLSVLTCGIGFIALQPYMEATFAELYQVMREKAQSLNLPGTEKLSGFCPEQ